LPRLRCGCFHAGCHAFTVSWFTAWTWFTRGYVYALRCGPQFVPRTLVPFTVHVLFAVASAARSVYILFTHFVCCDSLVHTHSLGYTWLFCGSFYFRCVHLFAIFVTRLQFLVPRSHVLHTPFNVWFAFPYPRLRLPFGYLVRFTRVVHFGLRFTAQFTWFGYTIFTLRFYLVYM